MSLDLYAVRDKKDIPKDYFGCCGFHTECTERMQCVRTGKYSEEFASKCSLFRNNWHKRNEDTVNFVELHLHSTFSQKDGFGKPEQIVQRVKELGMKAVAITDHHNTSAHPQLEKACRKHEIKPIYGCEFYIVPKLAKNQHKKNHITVLAKNLTGYQNITQLASLGYREGNFYYMPTIDLKNLLDHKEGLIILDGCSYGIISKLLIEEKFEQAMAVTQWFKKHWGEDFYLEVQPLDYEMDVKFGDVPAKVSAAKIAPLKAELAEHAGVELVATNDVHFLEPGQEFIQNFLRMVRVNGDVNNNQGYMNGKCHIATGRDMADWFQELYANYPAAVEDFKKAVSNTVKVANKIESYELPKAEMVRYPTDNAKELFLKWCREGWKERGYTRLKGTERQKYLDRFNYEVSIIEQKDFIDYFLVVADAVKWAKSDRPFPNSSAGETKEPILVGPARGSAAGSLVSYLLEITEIDPIKFDLLFERFIDVSRSDFPDIDIDFESSRRDEVKEYLRQKYGLDFVTNIAGYTEWHGKSLLDDIGRCFKINRKMIDEAKNDLIENGGSKNVEEILQERWPELVELAKVEGMVRGMTVHAAGVVVATQALDTLTTVGRSGVMVDKRDAEYLNLLKIDALSLKTLDIIKLVLNRIGKDAKWLYSLPLDDRKTLQGFNDNKFMGVFQFEGHATKGVCNQLNVQDFQITIDITALSRPGPLQTGATKAYIENAGEAHHPLVAEHTARSRGYVLYQEQMMRILRGAGLDWADVTTVRKLVTKKEGYEKLEGIKERFLQYEGFSSRAEGEQVWQDTVGGGGYGFNISHACSYSHITYYTMYLKQHHPLEFYWANMVIEPDNKSMLKEFQQNGGRIYGVKYGRSDKSWSIDRGGLRAGYLTIKGIGPKMADKLIAGEKPKGKALTLLKEAGAYDEQENTDYLGLEELGRVLTETVPERDKIASIQPGELVKVAGAITELHVKNLREYYEKNGKDYSEVRSPEKCLYINMKLMDETGDIMVTVNRYMCADPLLFQMLTNREDGQLFVVLGERAKDYEKVYATRITLAEDEEFGIVDED